MSISERQSKSALNDTFTFDNTPLQGSLLIVNAGERSGATSASISGTGWTQEVAQFPDSGSTTWRKSQVVFWKVAGASEPTTITITWGTSGSEAITGIELQTDASETFTKETSASANSGQNSASSQTTGTTSSISTTNNLIIGAFTGKQNNTAVWTAWTNSLTSAITADGGSNAVDAGIAWKTDTATGTKESTVSGAEYNRGACAGIIVFSVSGGGTGATINATTIAATAAVPAPTVEGHVSVTPPVISAVSSLPSPTVQAFANVNAAIISALAAVPSPSIQGFAEVNAAVIATLGDVPAVTVETGTPANINAETIAALANIHPAVIESGATISPSVVAAISAIATPVIEGFASIDPGVISALSSVPAPTIEAGAAVEPNDYVLAYDIDEGTGTLLNEKGGGTEDLTLSGSYSWTTGPGTAGEPSSDDAVDFTGGHAENTSISDPFSTNECTIAVLCRMDNITQDGYIIQLGPDTASLYLAPWDGQVYAGGHFSGVYKEASTAYSANVWDWWIFTITDNGADNTIRIYKGGGSQLASFTFSDNLPSYTRICLGKNTGSGSYALDGKIASVRIYDRVLSQSERASIGNESTGESANISPSVIAALSALAAPTVEGHAAVDASVISGVTLVPASTISIDTAISPTTVSAIASVLAATVGGHATVSSEVISVLADIPAVTVSTGTDVSIDASTIAALSSVLNPTVVAGSGATISPVTVAAVTAVLAPSIQAGAEITPLQIAALTAIPSVVVEVTSSDANINVDVIQAVANILPPEYVGTLWNIVLDSPDITLWTIVDLE